MITDGEKKILRKRIREIEHELVGMLDDAIDPRTLAKRCDQMYRLLDERHKLRYDFKSEPHQGCRDWE